MLNLDTSKLMVLAVLAIVLLGPEKLPSAARQIALFSRSITKWREKMESEVRSTLPDLPSTSDLANMIRSPSALLNQLAPFEDVSAKSVTDNHIFLGNEFGFDIGSNVPSRHLAVSADEIADGSNESA